MTSKPRDSRQLTQTGTNWIRKCPLVDVDKMKKNERESFDFRSDDNIEIVRWNDNSVVTIECNVYGLQPIGSAKRWTKGKGKQNIQQPAIIAAYDRGMGVVDLLNHALSNLRPVICGKKWYWSLVINTINLHLYKAGDYIVSFLGRLYCNQTAHCGYHD